MKGLTWIAFIKQIFDEILTWLKFNFKQILTDLVMQRCRADIASLHRAICILLSNKTFDSTHISVHTAHLKKNISKLR